MRVFAAIVLGLGLISSAAAQAPTPPLPVPAPPSTTVPPTPAPVPPPPAPATPPGAMPTPAPGDTAPPFTFSLGAASNAVQPFTHGDAKTEEGKIDVSTEGNTLKVVMTGGVGANVFLGAESIANQTFQLVQEFDITPADPNVREVVLAVDSGLIGFVRAKHKASACVHLACVRIAPACWSSSPIGANPPLLCVSGPAEQCRCPVGMINKDPLPQIVSQPLPVGRYVLQADFVIQATARGILDAHSTAIFSPEPTELDPWEREHDPYKGEDKGGYGFTTIVTAVPVGGSTAANAWKKNRPAPKVAKRSHARTALR